MTFSNRLKSIFASPSTVHGPSSGLYHYAIENPGEKSRVHLRVNADGHGTLVVNANRIMHLNPTAALMAWLLLEKVDEKDAVKTIQCEYRVSANQARSDLSNFNLQLDELIRPDGSCPPRLALGWSTLNLDRPMRG